MPYSLPFTVGGAFIYDFRALQKFFDEDGIGVSMTRSTPSGSLKFHYPTRDLWTGERPCAADFIQQLKTPIQVEHIKKSFHLQPVRYRISDSLTLFTAGWVRHSQSFREKLGEEGVSSEEFAKVEQLMDEVVNQLIAAEEDPEHS